MLNIVGTVATAVLLTLTQLSLLHQLGQREILQEKTSLAFIKLALQYPLWLFKHSCILTSMT